MAPPEQLRETLTRLPRQAGVYVFRDAEREVLYVGKAKSLRARVRSYFGRAATDSLKLARLVPQIAGIETFVTASESEALLLESNLIKEFRPRFNVHLRDDKSFPYVKVTLAEPFPRVLVTRHIESDGSRYFGPFTNVGAMRRALRLITRRFRVRTCHYPLPENGPDRPCLDFHIHRCLAPCVGHQSREAYGESIREVVRILSGHTASLRSEIRERMRLASDELEFETAAELRDVLQGLEVLERRQTSVDFRGGDRDVLGVALEAGTACTVLLRVRSGHLLGREVRMLQNVEGEDPEAVVDAALREFTLRQEDLPAEVLVPVDVPNRPLLEQILTARRGGPVQIVQPRRGSKRRLTELAEQNARHLLHERSLADPPESVDSTEPSASERTASVGLQSALGLPAPPRNLLCFDISTLGGSDSVGSAVWLRDGRAHREEYRRFRIRETTDGATDDYAMMQEVVGRYFQRRVRDAKPLPDLVLIDGGKGQLGAALQAMEGAGVSDLPVAALAKRREEVFLPGRNDPVVLDRTHPSLHWLQRARDEAHRFAVGYNRRLRRKRTLRTALRDVPGVGRSREAELLRRFGSPAAIAALSRSDLMAVPGIGPATAKKILETLLPPVEDDADDTR